MKKCPICGNMLVDQKGDYYRCIACGVDVRKSLKLYDVPKGDFQADESGDKDDRLYG